MAGRKAKVLWRLHDGTAALTVEDEHDDVMVIVQPDGSMYEERIGGLGGLFREAWDATKPAEKMLVPDDAGRKKWTHLEPDPAPEPAHSAPVEAPVADAAPAPEPSPAQTVSPEVERNARALADAVRGRGRTCRELFHGRVPASYEPEIAFAVSQGWVVTEGDVVRLGPVDCRPPEPVGDVSLNSSRGWSRMFG